MDYQLPFDTSKVIAQNIKFYHSIKPKIENNSYTVIASLNDSKSSELLAIATGTQACLKKYDNDIEDCHAESLLKRAYKRYVLDKILSVIDKDNQSHTVNDKSKVFKMIDQINSQELVLFISQFPCGLIKRFEGAEPIDEETGSVIVRKPGRGQIVAGKVVYVQRDNCLNKLKTWTIKQGFQGKSLHERLNIQTKLIRIVIGDCEPDLELDYKSMLSKLAEELSPSKDSIKYDLVHMRQEEFTFQSDDKQPLPVATVWWASPENGSSKCKPEYIVDGRKLGITKKQCITNNHGFKLRSSDFWLRKDLDRIHAVITYDRR